MLDAHLVVVELARFPPRRAALVGRVDVEILRDGAEAVVRRTGGTAEADGGGDERSCKLLNCHVLIRHVVESFHCYSLHDPYTSLVMTSTCCHVVIVVNQI